ATPAARASCCACRCRGTRPWCAWRCPARPPAGATPCACRRRYAPAARRRPGWRASTTPTTTAPGSKREPSSFRNGDVADDLGNVTVRIELRLLRVADVHLERQLLQLLHEGLGEEVVAQVELFQPAHDRAAEQGLRARVGQIAQRQVEDL